jgi:mannose-6-phosphate isomerase-like protein (cupin superfamily)
MTCSTQLRLAARVAIGGSIAVVLIASTAEFARAQAPLHSAVFPADSARSRRSTPANTQRSIVDTLTATLAKLEMHETTVPAGGAPHAPHRHMHEELLVIRTGEMEVLQGTVKRIAKVGDVVFMASNEWHGLKNPGTIPATYLVIRIDPHDIPPNGTSSTVPPAAAAAPR